MLSYFDLVFPVLVLLEDGNKIYDCFPEHIQG